MSRMKKVLALGLACGLLLTACGGKDAPVDNGSGTSEPADSQAETTDEAEAPAEDKAAADSGEKQTLRVAWWGSTERDKIYYQINDMFMAEHPNVEIVTESPGWNDYWVAQSTAYASNSAADVVQFQSNQIGEYCSKGVLTPLQPYVESGAINLEGWNQDLVDTGKYEDQLYMISLGITAQTLYINETFLNELGVELWPADQDITWDEYAQFLQDVQAKLGADTYAGMDIYTNNDLVWVWIRENSTDGQEWLDEDGNFAPSADTLESWYAFSDDMRKAGAFPSVEWTHEWLAKAWEEGALVNRKVVCMFENANKYKIYQNSMEDKLAIRKVPVGNNGKHGDLLITSAFGISESSKQKDLAAEYIDFFVNNMEAQKVFNQELGVPASLTVQEELSKTADPSDVAAAEYVNMVAAQAPPFVAKAPGVWAIQDEINGTAEMVATGMMSAREGAEHIIGIANEMIAENAN